jgi:hypothetical protein
MVAVFMIPTAGALEGLSIPSFHSDITVNTDGTLTVQEEFTTRVQYLN